MTVHPGRVAARAVSRSRAVPAVAALGQRRSAKWRTYSEDVIPAFIAEMDIELAPPIKEALLDAVERSDCGYTAPGANGLAEAFAGFAERRMKWSVDPANVVAVPDVMVGIADLLRVLVEPGDGVVINPPVYPPFATTLREIGLKAVPAPMVDTRDGWGIDLYALEAAFQRGARAYLLCNPHNPTGRVLSRDELGRIADIAARYDAWVLSDEIHAPLAIGDDAEHVPFASVAGDAVDRSIVLTSATKAFNLAGLKCAVAVASSARARGVLDRLPADTRYRTGHLGAIASSVAFRDCDDWLDALLLVLRDRRALLERLLAEHVPTVRYRAPQASYLAWLDCRTLGLGDDPARAFLDRGRVALASGLDFGEGGAGFARVTFATEPEVLREIVERIADSTTAQHQARERP